MRPPAPAVLGLLLLLLPTGEATKKPTPCKRCRELVDKFNQGMVDTAKKNFGGGNTAWEEKTLSKYEFSEVRLLEIVEGLCEASDFECNQLLEEQEELLEAWWLRLKKKHPDLFEWFCVQTLKACCSPGTYGPDCLACDEACKTCVGPTNRDCGQCEVGWVRQDDACVDVDECAAEPPPCEDTQYCENVNGSFVCEECDPTCVGCTGKGPAQCRECITGYSKQSGQCEDIDECSLAEKPCLRDNENCYNTPGSFVCVCPDGFEEAEDTCVQTRPAGAEATEASPPQPPSREDL
ncbi:protein disulfide isomerase CRELD2 isoform X2 [Bubalus kerabau]|uniref:protein disulfide isomerase CRELD2 isoform X3 n=1 Tax=Bubalus bubalis TaxID=89462 RepID=UPI001D11EDCC|nr:protein disulfide isomerase CRELD2 isoform X3 [Bubalus bubalis]XP_055421982.1 protein disulfide isomerase CRELD2 isoform X2 [Bubalus carabanensis]